MEKERISPIFKGLAAATLFGISAPLSKILLGEIVPIAMAGFLYLGSGLSAALFLLLQNNLGTASEARLRKTDIPWLGGALLAGGVAAPITLMYSLQATPAATAALLLNFEGVATTLIAALAFREAIGRRIWGAIGLVTLASIALSWEGQSEWGLSLGALGILLACVLWGIDNNFTRNISGKNPLIIVAAKGIGAGLFSLTLNSLIGSPFPSLLTALGAMLLGSVCYGLSIVLFILAMRDLGAARTSALFSTSPFIGTLLALLIFREALNPLLLLALPLMIAGTVLLIGETHRHTHQHAVLSHEHRHRHDDEHHGHEHAPDETPLDGWHAHSHTHTPQSHTHPHTPDLHHRHAHQES